MTLIRVPAPLLIAAEMRQFYTDGHADTRRGQHAAFSHAMLGYFARLMTPRKMSANDACARLYQLHQPGAAGLGRYGIYVAIAIRVTAGRASFALMTAISPSFT